MPTPGPSRPQGRNYFGTSTMRTKMGWYPIYHHHKWCQDAFGAILTQKFKYALPSGRIIQWLHPLGFTSKRISKTKEKYKPFLLEFSVLKSGCSNWKKPVMQPNQNWFFWNCQFWFCLMLAGSSSSFRIPGGGEKPLKPSFNWFLVVYIISTTLHNKVLKVTKYI